MKKMFSKRFWTYNYLFHSTIISFKSDLNTHQIFKLSIRVLANIYFEIFYTIFKTIIVMILFYSNSYKFRICFNNIHIEIITLD